MSEQANRQAFPYWTRVATPAGEGHVVGWTSRSVRVFLDGGGSTNRGRHSGEGHERGFRPSQVERVQP